MKKTITAILMASGFLIIASLGILGITFGWFVQSTTLPGGTVSVGDLRYELAGGFVEDEIIVPGWELVDTPFVITNNSPIASQLRLKITYTRVTVVEEVITPEEDYVYKGDEDDHLAVDFTSSFTFGDGDLTPDEYDDDYWYYGDYETVILAESGALDLIDSIYYDGYMTSIDYFSQSVTVTLLIEVKQADHVEWSELATYDFATGDPLP